MPPKPPAPSKPARSASSADADADANADVARILLAHAKLQRIVSTWLPPPTEEELQREKQAEEERRREEEEALRAWSGEGGAAQTLVFPANFGTRLELSG